MPFVSGQKRPDKAGRKKGSLNKRTVALLEAVDVVCERLNANPFEIMARFAADESMDASLRLQAAKELAQYILPKKRAIEHSGSLSAELTGDKEHPLVTEIRQAFHNEAAKGK